MFTKLFTKSILVAVLITAFASACYAQTLYDPLVPGAASDPPFIPASTGAPPSYGDGPIPMPTNPGMGGPPTLLPWVPSVPADNIDLRNSGIPLPISPPLATPPGVLGPMLTPFVPGPASTPGFDPGMLNVPPDSPTFNPSAVMPVLPGGGYAGTGGYYTTIPNIRRGGQQTHQWEIRGRNASIIPGLGDGSQSEVTQLGPYAGLGVPFGVPTGDGLRNSSIDLGGGMTFKVGNTKLSTGTSLQDYGYSALRYNPIPALNAQRSTEFGQGFRRMPIYSSRTTDFGLPYTQSYPGNVGPQATGQLLPPKGVITNF